MGPRVGRRKRPRESAFLRRAWKLDEVSREARETEVEFRSYKEHNCSSNATQVQAIAELKVSVDRLSGELDTKQTEVVQQKDNIEATSAYVTQLEQKLRYAEKGRRDLHNTIQARAARRA